MNLDDAFPRVDARLIAALGIVSAAVTAQQIVLLQVLGWTHWHHFSYLVVAVALLGFGIAGTVLTLARDALYRRGNAAVAWLILITALSIPIGVRVAQAEALAVDLPLVFYSAFNAWKLAALCGLLLPPFFTAGLLTGMLLAYHASAPGRLYAASLGGAGAGGLIGLTLAATVPPPHLPPAVGAIAIVAAFARWGSTTVPQKTAIVGGSAAILALLVFPGALASSQFKPLSRVLEMPGARIIASRPSLRGWIQVVAAPALRPAPTVSFNYLGEVPPHPSVFVNGSPYGALPDPDSLRDGGWLDHTTDAAAFAVAKPSRVLLLENGPGGWPYLALSHDASTITVVEPNRALVQLLTRDDPLAPEWRANGVTVIASDGRQHLRRTRASYDVIRFPTVGALGGSAGLGSAGEQFLFTREAVLEAWEHLSMRGILTVTAFMDFPERNPLRLLATLVEVLAQLDIEPRAHLAAVRSWAGVTFLARASPWDPAAVEALREFCDDRGFDILLAPGVDAEARQSNHVWQNPAFFTVVDALVDGPREPVYATYPFLLRPATDQRPYFSQFMRLSHAGRVGEVFGARNLPFFELGSLVVGLTFALLLGLGLVCIILPLAFRGWRVPGKTPVLLYFGGLGAGFMCVEMASMLEAQAWLGSPVTSAAAVITTLLLASAVGSLWSERRGADQRTHWRVLLLVIVGVALAGALHASAASAARVWPLPLQYLTLFLLIATPGFVMGMAFPLGLRRLSHSQSEHIPWAWAINGCVSVATPAGATLLAMSLGFVAMFVAAVVAYSLALVATTRW